MLVYGQKQKGMWRNESFFFLGWEDMGEFFNLTFLNSVLVFLIVIISPKLHRGQCLQLL